MKISYTLFLLVLVLCGCSYIKGKPQTKQEQLCAELKSDIVFNTDSVSSMNNSSAAQHAETIRLYEKNGCDKL